MIGVILLLTSGTMTPYWRNAGPEWECVVGPRVFELVQGKSTATSGVCLSGLRLTGSQLASSGVLPPSGAAS
jgi:hypothetical protein